jgi:hypothetical protein
MNWYLAAVGAVLIAIAACGLFLQDNAALCGTFVFLGTATTVLAVIEERAEGDFLLSATGLKMKLIRRKTTAADSELKSGTVVPVDEVIQP